MSEECILPVHTLIGLVKDVKNVDDCPSLNCLKLVPKKIMEGFQTSGFEFKVQYEWILSSLLEQDFENIRLYCKKTENAFFGLIYGFFCESNPYEKDAISLKDKIYPITLHIDEAATVPKINEVFEIQQEPGDYLEDLDEKFEMFIPKKEKSEEKKKLKKLNVSDDDVSDLEDDEKEEEKKESDEETDE